MFFINHTIHTGNSEPEGIICPQCGQSHWADLQWCHLPFRYSPACCVMTVTESLALGVLLYLGAEFIWGSDMLHSFLLSPLGWISVLVGATSCIILAALLVWATITTKYWAYGDKRINAVLCLKCRYPCLIISDKGNK